MVEEQQCDMRRQVARFATALTSFSSSPDSFRVLTSIPPDSPPPSQSSPPSTLYVLDSSFNPPTLAHLHIALSALTQDHHHHHHSGSLTPQKSRLLLLLATQNADKAPQPAAFEQRLMLMSIFAEDLRKAYSYSRSGATATSSDSHSTAASNDIPAPSPVVDIGVTKHPMFVDKASSITASGFYPPHVMQVHLTGYDTLIRILDPKYYPPTHTLAPLEPFLSRHRLRVTCRTESDWGGRAEQEAYLVALADGDRESEGGMREWAEKIELVEGRKGDEEVISSTRVREAVRDGDRALLKKLVSAGVADWVLLEKLYVGD